MILCGSLLYVVSLCSDGGKARWGEGIYLQQGKEKEALRAEIESWRGRGGSQEIGKGKCAGGESVRKGALRLWEKRVSDVFAIGKRNC